MVKLGFENGAWRVVRRRKLGIASGGAGWVQSNQSSHTGSIKETIRFNRRDFSHPKFYKEEICSHPALLKG